MPKNIPKIKLRNNRTDNYFNYRMRNARIDKNYTLLKLGKESGVSKESIENYERLRYFPSQENAKKISTVLDKNIDYLFPNNLKSMIKEINRERNEKNGKLVRIISLEIISEEELNKLIIKEKIYQDLYDNIIEETNSEISSCLTYREREIIRLFYGLNDNKPLSDVNIGNIFKLTGSRIGQIRHKAIRKLQRRLYQKGNIFI
jgi:DNA-directed RNA polymerase sigma subunit (sigma70/sigma32)